MKAEERKHLKENELAERLGRFWQAIASGSTINTVIWGVILVVLALGIGWRYYSDATSRTRSAQWTAVEEAFTTDDLERIIKDNPGTIAARTAKYHLNRFRMDEALAGVGGPTSEERKKAADTLVEVRNRYSDLVRESADEPELVQEAMMGVAKAEEVLAAVPKDDNPNEPRGSLEAARKDYEELAKKYGDSFLGKQAAKRVAELRDHAPQISAFYDGLMEVHGKPPSLPNLPPLPPTPPPSGPSLPEAPKAPEAKGDASKTPPPSAAPAPSAPAAPSTPVPIPPNAPPNGISPEAPKAPPEQPKPKAP
jgi:hypothetical protein